MKLSSKLFRTVATLAVLFALTFTTFNLAAQPAPPAPAQSLQEHAQQLSVQLQLLYERLHGITEFQEYLQVRQQYETAMQQINQAAKPVATPSEKKGIVPVPGLHQHDEVKK